jgi:hypothetical protein
MPGDLLDRLALSLEILVSASLRITCSGVRRRCFVLRCPTLPPSGTCPILILGHRTHTRGGLFQGDPVSPICPPF